MTNTTPTPDLSSSAGSARRIAPELAALIARHSGEPAGAVIELQAGDPLFVAETARTSRRYPVTATPPNGTLFATDLYGFDGSQLRWRDQDEAFTERVFPGAVFTGAVNHAFIGDGFVAVGRGEHVFAGEEGGEWVYMPVLSAEAQAAWRIEAHEAAEARFLAEHAEQIEARRPAWATEVSMDRDEHLDFSAPVGKVTAVVEVPVSGPQAWTALRPVIIVDVMDSVLSPADAVSLAADLAEAARILGEG